MDEDKFIVWWAGVNAQPERLPMKKATVEDILGDTVDNMRKVFTIIDEDRGCPLEAA